MYVYIVTILHTSNVYNYMPVFLNKVKINNEKTSKFKTEKNKWKVFIIGSQNRMKTLLLIIRKLLVQIKFIFEVS